MAHCLWFRKRSPRSDLVLHCQAVMIDRPRPATDQKANQMLPPDIHGCIADVHTATFLSFFWESEMANRGFLIPEC